MVHSCFLSGFLILVAATPLMAWNEPQPLPKSAQGDWVAVDIEYCGQRPPMEIIRQYKIRVREKEIVLAPLNCVDGKFNLVGDPIAVRYQQDPTVSPKRVDFIVIDDGAEHRMQGIYAVAGKQLKICWQHDGKGRPSAFSTKAEPSQMLLVLERPKP